MKQLERDCLTYFSNNYRNVTAQIKNYHDRRAELLKEINSIDYELSCLEQDKERILNTFANAMLHMAEKTATPAQVPTA